MSSTLFAGRYRLGGALGHGGVSMVVAADDVETGRSVAIKRLHPALAADPEHRTRLERAGRALARVDHPHVVRLLAAATDEAGAPYLVLERHDAPRLAELLAASPDGLPVARALGIVAQVLDALAALHAAGFLHRDLKPDNVFVADRDGRDHAILFDLSSGWREGDERVTPPGVSAGSFAYAAPERVRGEASAVGPAADVWAAGVLLYECLTGERPFRGAVAEAMDAILDEPPPPMRAFRRGVPAALDEVVLRALEKDPKARYPDAASMREVLIVQLEGFRR